MTEEGFRRAVLTPYWCSGSPLAWVTPEGVEIAQMARDGKVGKFNLCWWLLNRQEPPPASVYKNTNLLWAIVVADRVMVQGRSLEHHASMLTQRDFQQLLRDAGPSLRPRVEKQGMQWSTLMLLASTSKEL